MILEKACSDSEIFLAASGDLQWLDQASREDEKIVLAKGSSSYPGWIWHKMTGTDHDVCLFDLILYIPSTIFQLNRDRFSWVEPVLS